MATEYVIWLTNYSNGGSVWVNTRKLYFIRVHVEYLSIYLSISVCLYISIEKGDKDFLVNKFQKVNYIIQDWNRTLPTETGC